MERRLACEEGRRKLKISSSLINSNQEDTDLVDVAIGTAAYSLDELVLVLRIPTTYVTRQRVRVHRSHRGSGEENDRRGERSAGHHLVLRAGT